MSQSALKDLSLPRKPVTSVRMTELDGSQVDVFALPTDAESLEILLRVLFENHWEEIIFGPIVQGAAWEWKAPCAPKHISMFDGYITIGFGAPHFHLCIGEHKGVPKYPVPEALAKHRRTSRAEMYRQLNREGTPISWGIRLFNGKGEQQITILLPNPFLSPTTGKVLKTPEWSHLTLWDSLRAHWFGLTEPDPIDRSASRFRCG